MNAQLELLQIREPITHAPDSQISRIFNLMKDVGGEWTLFDLQINLRNAYGLWAAETSISMRLREIKRGDFPGWTIEKRTENGRTYFYKLVQV